MAKLHVHFQIKITNAQETKATSEHFYPLDVETTAFSKISQCYVQGGRTFSSW